LRARASSSCRTLACCSSSCPPRRAILSSKGLPFSSRSAVPTQEPGLGTQPWRQIPSSLPGCSSRASEVRSRKMSPRSLCLHSAAPHGALQAVCGGQELGFEGQSKGRRASCRRAPLPGHVSPLLPQLFYHHWGRRYKTPRAAGPFLAELHLQALDEGILPSRFSRTSKVRSAFPSYSS